MFCLNLWCVAEAHEEAVVLPAKSVFDEQGVMVCGVKEVARANSHQMKGTFRFVSSS